MFKKMFIGALALAGTVGVAAGGVTMVSAATSTPSKATSVQVVNRAVPAAAKTATPSTPATHNCPHDGSSSSSSSSSGNSGGI